MSSDRRALRRPRIGEVWSVSQRITNSRGSCSPKSKPPMRPIDKLRLPRKPRDSARELSSLFEFFATFPIAPFDQAAADLFESLQAARVRIATRDLRIAAITLT